jgi:hypothetical protein
VEAAGSWIEAGLQEECCELTWVFQVKFSRGNTQLPRSELEPMPFTSEALTHSGTTYIDKSVLVKVSGHKLLLYAHFSTYLDNSYTFVKVFPSGLQNGLNHYNWSIFD